MLKILAKLGDDLDRLGYEKYADKVTDLLQKISEEKWMQKAVNPKEKGELHEKLNVPKDETIPTSLLEKKKKQLQEKGEGDKKLSPADRETLSQIQFALNARKSKAEDQS